MTQDRPRLGKLPPMYHFILNPHTETRVRTCPGCEQRMRPCKVPLFIHVVGYGGMRRDMRRDAEIEAVGMQVAMAYEREHGWHPEDVSAENLGFDIRSTRYNDDGSYAGTRYVEVKARAQSGAIRLSANEWKKAGHFGDRFWLYVITGAATDAPQLQRIRDPVSQFQVGEDIFSTGFIIPEDRWREKTSD